MDDDTVQCNLSLPFSLTYLLFPQVVSAPRSVERSVPYRRYLQSLLQQERGLQLPLKPGCRLWGDGSTANYTRTLGSHWDSAKVSSLSTQVVKEYDVLSLELTLVRPGCIVQPLYFVRMYILKFAFIYSEAVFLSSFYLFSSPEPPIGWLWI